MAVKEAISWIEVSRGMRRMWSGDWRLPCQETDKKRRVGEEAYLGIGIVYDHHLVIKVPNIGVLVRVMT